MVQHGALTTTLAEDLDNSETGVDVADETGITTDNDVILVGEELMIVTATTDDNTLTVARGHSGTTATTLKWSNCSVSCRQCVI